jgi:L-cystine uptake protein TcyP (sodium:dicarboxylate symporter family)
VVLELLMLLDQSSAGYIGVFMDRSFGLQRMSLNKNTVEVSLRRNQYTKSTAAIKWRR